MSKKEKIIRLALSALVTIAFLVAGGMQLMGKMTAQFVWWGFPPWSVYVVGGIQVFGALGIWFKKFAVLAVCGLIVITIGAIFTHIGHHDWPVPMLIPIGLFLASCTVFRFIAKQKDAASD